MTTPRILIADDDRTLRRAILFQLTAAHYDVSEAATSEEAIELASKRAFDLVITDLKIPDIPHGMQIVRKVKEKHPATAVLVLTSYNTVELAVQAMRAGADDFVTKDATVDEIKLKVDKVLQHRELRLKHSHLQQENDRLKRQLNKQNQFQTLVAKSESFQETLKLIAKVAEDGTCTVLLHGESGTGKERIARAIHYNSNRRERPFVPVKIAPPLEDLMEVELFGKSAGGFSNGVLRDQGKFQKAAGGTLFLFDVADMSAKMQERLLQMLREQAAASKGRKNGRTTKNVRVISATTQDIAQKAAEGSFDPALLKLLNKVRIQLPSLRDRRDDIPLLAKTLIDEACKKRGKVVRLRSDVLEYLKRYDWPGNIRELKNSIDQLVLMTTNSVLTVDSLPGHIRSRIDLRNINIQHNLANLADAKNHLLRTFEKTFIKDALNDHQWNVSRTAKAIGISREGLHRMIKRYGLCREPQVS